MLRISIYYLFSLGVMTIYGGQVCPFIDTLTIVEWGLTLAVFFIILFGVRHQLIAKFVFSKPAMEQPRQQMIFEFSLFIIAGLVIAIYNHFVYVFPPIGSGGKVTVGMFTLGAFLAIDMALLRERLVIQEAKKQGSRFAPVKDFTSLIKKFTIFAILVLSFVSVVILLVISKDIYWISMVAAEDISSVQRTISFEVMFVVLITLGLVLNLIYSYSQNLKLFFANETQVLSEVNLGNLDGYVPVVSRDEFAHIAQHTNQMIDGLREKRRIQNIFGKVVSPEVATHLLSLEEGEFKLGGQRKKLVILVSDIRGFTSLTEDHEAEELVHGLNLYFTDMVEIIHREQGIVDKFIGDGILAVFGLTTPELAAHQAINAALNMFKQCQLNGESYGIPVKIGIGIHSGDVIAGNIGSEERMEYTVIGDTVNIAARLESMTKSLEAPLLISKTLYEGCESSQQALPWQDFGPRELKGKARKIEILGLTMEQINSA
ncbi:MAG: adenylate/guanylate cyclase domain-containing protein [Candidatus Marinimicrobia bacterium]|nr:adenylate/guanylate cyclase domain-containing protein [FCB group bacterium]MBL7028239.1 adenylate/guanylate cyclase domain-containing protein [Candidatus Neomarinimicrobiota bacterium]